MATKVYLSGRNIHVEKEGETALIIRTDLAEYSVFIPFLSSDGLTPNEAENINFSDVRNGTSITDKIAEITDQVGTTYGNLTSLQAYLNTFFQRSKGVVVIKEGATSENQETLIEQNNTLIDKNTSIVENTSEIENIKDIEKDSNKILKKIYNHE
jgi:hypothetical protein